jgi:hypothetical protein
MKNKYKKYIPLFIVGGLLLLAAGIYIAKNRIGMATRIGSPSEPANFWLGLWQGLIICLAFITSWFDKNIVLYQVNNTGFWYNFGFVIGLTIAIGSSATSSKTKTKASKNKLECK